MTALQPGGARGYLSQLYGPLRASYADMFGLICDALSKLSVSCTCSANLSHSWRGKLRSVVARDAINASLNVCIARSAALTR